ALFQEAHDLGPRKRARRAFAGLRLSRKEMRVVAIGAAPGAALAIDHRGEPVRVVDRREPRQAADLQHALARLLASSKKRRSSNSPRLPLLKDETGRW